MSFLNRSTFKPVDSGAGFTLSRDGVLIMLNLGYDDDGSFTCTADNTQESVSQTFYLRVKCMLLLFFVPFSFLISIFFQLAPLRPLWPALGMVGVAILVSAIMFGSFSAEKIMAKKKARKADSSSKFD